MKKIFQILLTIQLVQFAMVLGSRLGALLHTLLTGRPAQGGVFHYQDDQGRSYVAVPPMTHALPGLVLSFIGHKRPWLWGFLGSCLAAAMLGDRFEKRLVVELAKRLPGSARPGDLPGGQEIVEIII